MQAIVQNMTFSREEFSHICFFLRQVFPDSIQIDNKLYLPEISDDTAARYYSDIGRECSESEYHMAKIIELCNSILEFRGKDRDRTKGIELRFEHHPATGIRTRYDCMIQEQFEQASATNLISTAEIACPPGYVQGIYDLKRRLLWFEAGDGPSEVGEFASEQVHEWCLRCGVTYQATPEKANDEIMRLCGPAASLIDETAEPEHPESQNK